MADDASYFEFVHVKEHKGIRIELSQRNWRFHIDNEDFTGENWYHSLDEATKAIDKQADDEAKLKVSDLKFEEAALDDKGDPITIIGINRATRNPRLKGGGTTERRIYPPVPWVGLVLKRIAEVGAELEKLQHSLRDLSIYTGGYGKIAAEHYPAHLAQFKQRLAQAKRIAEARAKEHKLSVIKNV